LIVNSSAPEAVPITTLNTAATTNPLG